jgi:leucyl/phenylalanyl-tRNA--protein transferase
MPVYRLADHPAFPPPSHAEPSGLLAVEGDLSPERLLAAYRSGIFPWYNEGEPILWFSPDPRMVLRASELRVPRGIRRNIRSQPFELRLDSAFEKVIRRCAEATRPAQDGTWITEDMIEAYLRLHDLGYAHSAEAWLEGDLVGGAYGVCIGRTFSGESMFHEVTGASQAALVALIAQLDRWGIDLIDCQTHTPHFERIGATEWPRERFLAALAEAVAHPTRRGRWVLELPPVLSSAAF